MKKTTHQALLASLLAGALVVGAAACGGTSDDAGDDGSGEPTPTPDVNPYEVCVAHFEVDAGDDPEVANLLLVVLLSEYWVGDASPVNIDGFSGAIYADYHYNFSGPALPEYVAAISTNATVLVTSSSSTLGSTAHLEISGDPAWVMSTGTGTTLSGGGASVADGTLQALADCTGGGCEYGTGSATLLVNGSSLTLGTANPDGIAVLYCRDLPSAFAAWRPGQPLPPGFREVFR